MAFFGGSNPVQQGNAAYVISVEGVAGAVDIDPLVQAVLDAQTSLGAFGPLVQTLIDVAVQQAVASLASSVQQQFNTLTLNSIGASAPLSPTLVGPVTDAGVTYNQSTFNGFVSQKAGAGGTPSPTAPVKNAAPTLAFTGGTGDVGENATYTQGTYTGGTVTSRDVNVIVNGAVVSTVTGIANGASIPIPSSAGLGARQFGIIELANWSGGAAVTNPSAVATINAPGVPANTTAPLISPSSATELTTLVPVQGSYTVNGSAVSNSTLTFTYRWTADWTLTGSLSGATSATLNAVWAGTTASYSVIFSDGSTKTTTLTNGSAAFSWTGAVTATSAIKVKLATTATLALNSNNIGHAMRYYETPTGSGGAGSEQQASNTVTPTSSAGGLAPGHRYLASIPSTGSQSWADYQVKRAAYPTLRTSLDAEAWVASIPTSGGVTLAAGATSAQINSALSANTITWLSQGTYNLSSMITIPANKWLIGLGTGAILNGATITSGAAYIFRWQDGAKCVNCHGLRALSLGVWFDGSNQRFYKVSMTECGYGDSSPSAVAFLGNGALDVIGVSSEAINTCGGGEGDGFKAGVFSGGNWTLVDCHGFENDDDNFDTWQTAYSSFFHYCTGLKAGRNTSTYAVSGDGNGFKLGGPTGSTIVHYLNQCISNDNKDYGFNYNGSTNPHTLRLCTGTGNLAGTYAFTGATPDSAHYTIVSV